jgi:hypothetical protein
MMPSRLEMKPLMRASTVCPTSGPDSEAFAFISLSEPYDAKALPDNVSVGRLVMTDITPAEAFLPKVMP